MIPRVRWYRLRLQGGRLLYVQTCSPALAEIVFRMDCPRYWGEAFTVFPLPASGKGLPAVLEKESGAVFRAKAQG